MEIKKILEWKDFVKKIHKMLKQVLVFLTSMFQKIIENFSKKKSYPLRAIETIDTLKLINMLYLSTSKNKWVANNKKLYHRG